VLRQLDLDGDVRILVEVDARRVWLPKLLCECRLVGCEIRLKMLAAIEPAAATWASKAATSSASACR